MSKLPTHRQTDTLTDDKGHFKLAIPIFTLFVIPL